MPSPNAPKPHPIRAQPGSQDCIRATCLLFTQKPRTATGPETFETLLGKYCQGRDCPLIRPWICSLEIAPVWPVLPEFIPSLGQPMECGEQRLDMHRRAGQPALNEPQWGGDSHHVRGSHRQVLVEVQTGGLHLPTQKRLL